MKRRFTKINGTNCFVVQTGKKFQVAHFNGSGYELQPDGKQYRNSFTSAAEVETQVRKDIAENKRKREQYKLYEQGKATNPYQTYGA